MNRHRTALVALAALACTTAARADNIDRKLYSEAQRVAEQIVKNKYGSVGVLHFRLQKGDGPESFTLGPICSSMATRLENALIISNPLDAEFAIARNATATAATRKIAGWQKRPSERGKLFNIEYSPAWGDKPVKPGAMLTGVVRLSKDLAITTVTIEAIPASAPQRIVKLHEFSVSTDRGILHDAGQSYAVPAAARGMRSFQRDEAAVVDARKRDLGELGASPVEIKGIAIQINYNDQPQEIRADPNSTGEYRVDPPKEGDKVVVMVRNLGTHGPKLGAALWLNGQSFWRQEKGDVTNSQIWILDAGVEQWTGFKGFFMEHSGNNLIPFKVLSEEQSRAREAEFGDKVGLLQLDVFEPGQAQGEDEMKISLGRGFARKGKLAKPLTLADAKRAALTSDRPLMRAARSSASHRNLIVGEDEALAPGGDLKSDVIASPTRVGSLTIRYYDPSSGGGASGFQISK